MLELIDVAKSYAGPDGKTSTAVLSKVSLKITDGETAAITGPSGSGKSTLLNLIGGLDRPDEGKVLFEGKDLGNCVETELAGFRRDKIGFIFQLHHLLPQCTVLENVLTPTLICRCGSDKDEPRRRALRLLERVGLKDRVDYMPGRLSGGERQRTAVVRALINQPQILLADEPTGALDKKASSTLTELLTELNKEEKVTLIIATHSQELAGKMEKVYVLQEGKLEIK